MKSSISVIVLTYNSERQITGCLRSIKKQLSNNDEIIVVDNASLDKTIEKVKKFKNINLIENKSNAGFARGINLGIKKSRKHLLLLVNPDAELKKNAKKKILECYEKTNASIIGGKLIKTDEKIHGSYVRSPGIATVLFDYTNLRKLIPGDFFHKFHYYEQDRFPQIPKEVDVVSGAFMLIDKKILNKTGSFDNKFFMYLEDVDLCTRAINKGFNIVYCPTAEAIHIGGASSKNKDKINHKAWYSSRSYYASKHFSKKVNKYLQPILKTDELLSRIWKNLK